MADNSILEGEYCWVHARTCALAWCYQHRLVRLTFHIHTIVRVCKAHRQIFLFQWATWNKYVLIVFMVLTITPSNSYVVFKYWQYSMLKEFIPDKIDFLTKLTCFSWNTFTTIKIIWAQLITLQMKKTNEERNILNYFIYTDCPRKFKA